jgi:hypothetical protein
MVAHNRVAYDPQRYAFGRRTTFAAVVVSAWLKLGYQNGRLSKYYGIKMVQLLASSTHRELFRNRRASSRQVAKCSWEQ